MVDTIRMLRDNLSVLLEKEASFEEIYEASCILDQLIVNYYLEQRKSKLKEEKKQSMIVMRTVI